MAAVDQEKRLEDWREWFSRPRFAELDALSIEDLEKLQKLWSRTAQELHIEAAVDYVCEAAQQDQVVQYVVFADDSVSTSIVFSAVKSSPVYVTVDRKTVFSALDYTCTPGLWLDVLVQKVQEAERTIAFRRERMNEERRASMVESMRMGCVEETEARV